MPERALQYILFRLPKLRELSLAVRNMNKWKLSLCFNVPDNFISTAEGKCPYWLSILVKIIVRLFWLVADNRC